MLNNLFFKSFFNIEFGNKAIVIIFSYILNNDNKNNTSQLVLKCFFDEKIICWERHSALLEAENFKKILSYHKIMWFECKKKY